MIDDIDAGRLQSNATWRLSDRIGVAAPSLDLEVHFGRDRFYDAVDEAISGDGAGVSCATCHFDSRNDGLSWVTTSVEGRQTPSLRGVVSETVPVSWVESVPTVLEEVHITTQSRMGGTGVTDGDASAIAAFIDSTPEIDLPLRGSDDPAIERGRAIFFRPEVACATCHYGAQLTDQLSHEMYGLDAVDTPSLVGVAATPPYLHDGSEPDLRSLLERVRDGSMGDTSTLNDTEMDDLEVYLKSL